MHTAYLHMYVERKCVLLVGECEGCMLIVEWARQFHDWDGLPFPENPAIWKLEVDTLI